MPIPLSSVVLEEKNRLATSEAFLLALEISVPGVDEPIRVVSNTENVTWRGVEWIAFPFEIDELSDTSKGEVPRIELKVSNVSRALERYIHDYDAYVKRFGFSPITVSIIVLNTADLGSGVPVVEHLFELKQPKTDAKWATFVLGASNPFDLRFPTAMLRKNACRFRFRDARCGYRGEADGCDKTLSRCRALKNSERFGGFPGVGTPGVYLAS
ncbi:DUF1833 family protein [Desulfocurvibacter africanus]|uniref:DUF1833 family protein n=1 Tax=Desulfocurvibacter africanus TaxID=873 RepID=UPI000425EF86|nr:DUF1833 family protein [Desulfocurvibacter africanus]